MKLFVTQECDVVVLEVGLGGRLDAVNIWDTDCALITSIALDHESWLGSDLLQIGIEKVGIARADTPLVVGAEAPPSSIASHANAIGAQLWQIGRDFHYHRQQDRWQLNVADKQWNLPLPSLVGEHQLSNAATVITAVTALQDGLPVEQSAVEQALSRLRLSGRFERRRFNGVEIVIDVAHNPAAAAALSQALEQEMPGRQAQAVFGIMLDKDIEGVVSALAPHVARWHCGQLNVPRACPTEVLAEQLSHLALGAEERHSVCQYQSMAEAFAASISAAGATDSDYVLVSGSFFTVTEVANCLN